MSDSAERPITETIPTVQRLGLRAIPLGAAKAIDCACQFLLPIVLVRCLDTADFGQYRLLWLAVGTIVAVATLDMPGSLYYFLPRTAGATKRLYINQTLVFLVLAGLASGWAVSAENPWLPEKFRELADYGVIVPALVLLYMTTSMLDLLPTVDERVVWQAKATVGLAVCRTAALSIAALLTHELRAVLLALLAFVVCKLVLLLRYVGKYHGLARPLLRWNAFAEQLKYAVPLGAAGALYGLRAQADQWVAATLFPLGMFASFSIAGVLGTLTNLFRQSVSLAFLPSMSRLEAIGDNTNMVTLNSRANVAVGALICPALAFAFVFAEELVTIVYTDAYVDAAPVMRIYIVGLAALVVELATITMLLRQGPWVTGINLVALIIAVPLNWFSARHFGLPGAAVGSVVVIYLDRIVTLWRIAALTGIPLRRLQDWRTLGLAVLLSILAALLAWATVDHYFAASGPLVRLVVGGAVLATAYIAMALSCGIGRDWLPINRRPKHEV
jgi:O-antigen/teichoic acid export membrane protein